MLATTPPACLPLPTPDRLLRGLFGFVRPAIALMAISIATSAPARAESFLIPNTRLVDVQIGSELSERMRSYANQNHTLSSGASLSLDPLYSAEFREVSATWITQVEPNLGIYWGLSTGETGEKYRIDPALKLGFVLTHALSRNSQISLSASTVLGGRLQEYPCAAETGSGGINSVNCRLAGSSMAAEDTLGYMFNEAPPDRTQITVRYTFSF